MKRVMSIVAVICLALQFIVTPYNEVYAFSDEFRKFVEDELGAEGQRYLSTQTDQIESVLVSCKKDLDIRSDECNKLEIGSPFVIYDEGQDVQEQILYYPVAVSDTDKVVAVISLMNTTVGWQYCIDTDWADELNRWNYMDSREDFIFCYKDGSLVAETSSPENQKSKNIPKSQDLDHKSFENKKQIVKAKMRNWRKIDVEENRKSKPVLKYTPTVTDELGYFYCNISGARGQGNNGLCWAASVATVVNYRTGTSYTAKNVADKMGIGYNDGATIGKIASALQKYGLNYTGSYSTMSFNSIKSEINSRYPFVIGGTSASKGGHAVTMYGYRDLTSGQYVMLWDSNKNNGQGGVTISRYNSSGMTYTTGNTAYTWNQTAKPNHVSYK